jgi:hypothetical protein
MLGRVPLRIELGERRYFHSAHRAASHMARVFAAPDRNPTRRSTAA